MNVNLINSIEALLFGAGRPIRLSEIKNILEHKDYITFKDKRFQCSIGKSGFSKNKKEGDGFTQKMSMLGVRNISNYNSRILEAQAKSEKIYRKVPVGINPETGEPKVENIEVPSSLISIVVVPGSGKIRDAFRKKGHDAWSCDIKPDENNNSTYHINYFSSM